jgi:GNAT superfamily N-acetyltransferase
MRAWLHALALLAVVIVFGASFALLSTVIGATSPWLALLLMFYFLGIAKVAQPLFTLRMPSMLYPLQRWEQEGALLRQLRIFSFGTLLRRTPPRYLNSGVYLDRQRRNFNKVRLQAESAEAIHFWAAVLFMPFLAFAAAAGRWSVVAWFFLAQVLVNIYPILHLRQIRGRLDRTIGRIGVAQQAELHIRDATPVDAQAMARLLDQLGYPTGSADMPGRMDRFANGGRAAILLAERNGQVIGLATAHILAVINRPRDVAWLTALVVDNDARGGGVGRALVRAVEAFAKAAGCERLSVTTHEDRQGARSFYLKIGMEFTGRRFGKALST